MKICFLFVMAIFLGMPLSLAGDSAVIPELSSDLPTVGQSTFDDIFGRWQDGQFSYELPPRFEDLLHKLKDYGEPVSLLIPYGRSLQRPFAVKVPENFNSAFERFWQEASGKERRSSKEFLQSQNMLFNPFRFPRVVVGLKNTGDSFPGFLFLGYLEPTNQIEVISFNKSLGRMEFQIVSNYKEGSLPKVHYVSRSKCLRCHITGGPIFSNFSWNETPNSSNVQNLMARAMSPDGFAKPIPLESEYHGTPLKSPNGYTIQSLVKEASGDLIPSIVWAKMCDGVSSDKELQCKRKFLREVLDGTRSEPGFQVGLFSEDAKYNKLVAPVIDSLFENRMIFEEFRENLRPVEPEQQFNILENQLEFLADKVRDMPEEFDPRQIRHNKGYRHKTSLTTGIRVDIGIHSSSPQLKAMNKAAMKESIAQAVASIPDNILLKRYFDLPNIRWFVHKAFKQELAKPSESKKLPKELLHSRHYLTGDLAPFERSCVRCHTGPSSFPPPFLYGKTQAEVAKSIQSKKDLILAYTEPETPAMPPVHDEYTSEDLVQIRDYVKGLGQENSGSITSFDSQSCQDYKPLPKKIDLSKVEEISDTQAMGLLTHYCSQCHQAGETWPPSIDLENVNGLRGNPLVLSHIRQAKMPDCSWVPKNGVPSNEERAKLIKWLGQ